MADSASIAKHGVTSETCYSRHAVHAHHGEEQDGDAMADLLTAPSYEQLESHCQPEKLAKE